MANPFKIHTPENFRYCHVSEAGSLLMQNVEPRKRLVSIPYQASCLPALASLNKYDGERYAPILDQAQPSAFVSHDSTCKKREIASVIFFLTQTGARRGHARVTMQFIHFSATPLTENQVFAIKDKYGERVECGNKIHTYHPRVLFVRNLSRFDDDGRADVTEIVDAIAREITHLGEWEDAVVLLQIPSPRVMAAFFEKLGSIKDFDDKYWSYIKVCCTFVFPYGNEFVELKSSVPQIT